MQVKLWLYCSLALPGLIWALPVVLRLGDWNGGQTVQRG
jgi:hypothetical protein